MIVCIKFDHGLVKSVQKFIAQVFVLSQVPHSSAVMVAPVVALSWEIDPFRVTELIAHKV